MLLRTVVLLFLCVSEGVCATLGHYQAEVEEEVTASTEVNAAAVDAAEEAVAQEVDSGAAEEPGPDSLFGDKLTQILADNPAASEQEVDIPVADGAKADEQGKDRDRPAGDTLAVKALTGEAAIHEQPSSEEQEQRKEGGNDIRPVQKTESLNTALAHEQNSWSLNSIRNSFQTVHGYFDSLVELVGGHNGVCQYRCRYGEAPQPRPGYQPSEPDGCSSSLVGFQVTAALDMGIPAMTMCCNQLDTCYETCGADKYHCDSKFRSCLHGICSDINKSLGFVSKVEACESVADSLFNTVWTLGCRPYMNSQRAACVCAGEERDEL